MDEVKSDAPAQAGQPDVKTTVVGTCVEVCDLPSGHGVHHNYLITPCNAAGEPIEPRGKFGRVKFQQGPVGEAGVNGCSNEDLLGIVMHRLAGFQSGPFPCNENGVALQHVQAALHWLQQRTLDRQARGVEGKSAA